MNNNFRDDEDKTEKMRLLTELVMLAMEDVEYQLKCLDMEQIEDKPVHRKRIIRCDE